ncbi:MAG: hypothetical protein ACI4NA_04050 [Succinivibrio sp.]
MCIVRNFLYGILTAAVLGAAWLASYLQARLGMDCTESLVEWVQLPALAGTAATFFWMARTRQAEKGGLVLMGSLFVAMFTRENDHLLNVDGFPGWECALSAYLAWLFFWERRHRSGIVPGLCAFARSSACPVMAVGLALLLVYSRLFGSHLIWQYLVWDDDTHFAVRRMVEESIELVAYLVMLIASRIYFQSRRQEDRKPRGAA